MYSSSYENTWNDQEFVEIGGIGNQNGEAEKNLTINIGVQTDERTGDFSSSSGQFDAILTAVREIGNQVVNLTRKVEILFNGFDGSSQHPECNGSCLSRNGQAQNLLQDFSGENNNEVLQDEKAYGNGTTDLSLSNEDTDLGLLPNMGVNNEAISEMFSNLTETVEPPVIDQKGEDSRDVHAKGELLSKMEISYDKGLKRINGPVQHLTDELKGLNPMYTLPEDKQLNFILNGNEYKFRTVWHWVVGMITGKPQLFATSGVFGTGESALYSTKDRRPVAQTECKIKSGMGGLGADAVLWRLYGRTYSQKPKDCPLAFEYEIVTNPKWRVCIRFNEAIDPVDPGKNNLKKFMTPDGEEINLFVMDEFVHGPENENLERNITELLKLAYMNLLKNDRDLRNVLTNSKGLLVWKSRFNPSWLVQSEDSSYAYPQRVKGLWEGCTERSRRPTKLYGCNLVGQVLMAIREKYQLRNKRKVQYKEDQGSSSKRARVSEGV